jgi:thioredoxin reductase (NADPH)
VVVASGARYNRPDARNLPAFEGRGVWYWASPIEARMCRGEDVVLVGGGNSAGQAAVFLAAHAARVTMLVRGAGLADAQWPQGPHHAGGMRPALHRRIP